MVDSPTFFLLFVHCSASTQRRIKVNSMLPFFPIHLGSYSYLSSMQYPENFLENTRLKIPAAGFFHTEWTEESCLFCASAC